MTHEVIRREEARLLRILEEYPVEWKEDQHRNNKDDPERNWKYDIQNCQKMQCECELS